MKFFVYSKTMILSYLVLFSFALHGQNVSFSLSNHAQSFDGTDSIFEVDVMIASQDAAGAFKMSSGLLYFNYNTTTFGTDIASNSRVSILFEDPAYLLFLKDNSAGIITVYTPPVLNDNTPSRFAVGWQQDRAEACISEIIDVTPKPLFRLLIKYQAGMSESPVDLCFESSGVFPDQTYTACGPTGACSFQGANCGADPGTRVNDDVFDCSLVTAGTDPVVVDDSEVINEDTPSTIDVTANDSDAEDGTLDPCNVSITTPPTNGTATVGAAPDCLITFTPNANYVGNDSFIYEVCDMDGDCGTGLVMVTVNEVNDGPTASDDTASTNEDTLVPISPTTNDSDIEDGTLEPCSVTIASQPANGSVTVGAMPLCDLMYTPNPDFCGLDTFEYEICDDGGLCDQATVSVSVSCVNDNPVVVADNPTVTEDIPTVLDLASNDSDVEDGALDPCDITIVTQPTSGTLTTGPAPTCELTYTPNPNFAGTDNVIYQICDAEGACSTGAVTIEVQNANDIPVAVDDVSSTDEDTPVALDLVANDSDIEDVTLNGCTVTITMAPTNGTITFDVAPLCNAIYTPNTNFNGIDSFQYEICDSGGLCASAVAMVTVDPVNDDPIVQADMASGDEDSPIVVDAVANDSDVEDGTLDPCSVTISNQPTNGTITIGSAPDCELTYMPNLDFNGNDSFVYEACDANGACGTASVSLTITAINDPCVAANDSATTDEDIAVNIPVTANDSDPENDLNLTSLSINTPPANGSVVANLDGSINYTPNPDFCGLDTFEYEICDGGGLCDLAIVDVTVACVNDAPIAINDTGSTLENTSTVIDLVGNDSDVEDGTPLNSCNVTILGTPSNGTISIGAAPTCEISYLPSLDYNGLDSFQYQVCDNNGACATADVLVTIQAVDPLFTSVDDTVVLDEDNNMVVDVLTNDTDPLNPVMLDPCAVTIVVPPSNGTVTFGAAPDCELTYSPDGNFNGNDSFVYQICFNTDCDQATVFATVNPVNDAPVANNDTDSTMEDNPTVVEVLTNDSDVDLNIVTGSVTIVSGPQDGTASVNPDGTVTYTPDTDFNGNDSFVYQVCDSDVLCATATALITVTSVNDAPVPTDDSDTTDEDLATTTSVLANDSDADGTLDLATLSVSTAPSSGGAVANGDGTITYTPNAGFNGTDTYEYEICDDGMPVLCATAVVTITVNPAANMAPTAVADSDTTDEDLATTTSVLANDSDADGTLDLATLSVSTAPSSGGAVANGDGTITYTPNAGFNGTDTYEYEICDDGMPVLCTTAVVTISVNPAANMAPTAVADSDTTDEDLATTTSVLANDSDADGTLDLATLSVSTAPSSGGAVANGDGTITYTPNAGFNGTDTYEYEICDDGMPVLCATAVVTITVNPAANMAPTAVADSDTTDEDLATTTSVLANDSDADGTLDLATLSVSTAPSSGGAVANGDGTITYTPTAGFNGIDTYEYEICDDGMPVLCATAVVTVDVMAPLTANNDEFIIGVDMTLNGNVLANDLSVVGGETLTIITTTSNGTVTLNPDGTFTYTPDLGYQGTDTFDYEVCNATVCDNATALITVSDTAGIPTMSEWGLILLTLLLLTFGSLHIRKLQPILQGANGYSLDVVGQQNGKLPFDKDLFTQVLKFIVVVSIIGLVVSLAIFGVITPVDFIGTILTSIVGSYLVHIWIMFYNE